MKRKLLITIGVLAVILSLVGAAEATTWGAPQANNASVKAVITAARSGNEITYSITLVNDSSVAAGDVYLAATLPAGVKMNVAASAVKGSSSGAVDGSVVSWLIKEVPAKGKAGPFTYKVTATQGDVDPVSAWVKWNTPAAGSSVSNSAEANYQLAKMRAISTADGEIMPGDKVAITLSGGYGTHDNNKIVTSGLPSVGIGEYAYLEGKDADATGAKVTAWAWELTQKPFGSKASLDNAGTQKPRFLADKAGQYVVKVTVTNDKGTKSSSSLTVDAGKYAGVSLCASCHDGSNGPDIVSTWAETGHATKFENTFASYSATSDYCVRCHTVGFNEAASSGGMDDAARAAGWNPANGSFMAWLKGNGGTLDDVKADSGMASMINIQCENCHGPGGSAHTQAKSYDPGVCDQCHGQGAQWKLSGHNVVNDHMSGNPSCVKCHTSQGFIEVQVKGNEAVFPNAADGSKPANMLPQEEQSGITCATCHDPHAATYPFKSGNDTKSLQLRFQGQVKAPMGWTADAGVSAVCVKCHSNNRTQQNLADFLAGKRDRGTHENTQSDVFYGQGAVDYGEKLSSSAHNKVVSEGCIGCHMAANPVADPGADGKVGTKDDVKVDAVGGHSFAVKGEWDYSKTDPAKGKTEVENVAVCNQCHGNLASFNRTAAADYDGDGNIEGIQDEVQGLLDLVASKLPKDANGEVLASGVTTSNTTAEQRKAIWNYSLIKIDGSKGIHNTAFTVQLLQKTYKHLTGSDVPGATLR